MLYEDFEKFYKEYRLQVEETQNKLDILIKKIDKYLEDFKKGRKKNDR